jgi:hypothetical protein
MCLRVFYGRQSSTFLKKLKPAAMSLGGGLFKKINFLRDLKSRTIRKWADPISPILTSAVLDEDSKKRN